MDLASKVISPASPRSVSARRHRRLQSFRPFLESGSATRRPPTARGRLFIGFAAADLLGLIAFAVAMIILYVFNPKPECGGALARRAAGNISLKSTNSPESLIRILWLCSCSACLFRDRLRHAARSSRPRRAQSHTSDVCRGQARGRPPRDRAAYRARIDESRAGREGRGRGQAVGAKATEDDARANARPRRRSRRPKRGPQGEPTRALADIEKVAGRRAAYGPASGRCPRSAPARRQRREGGDGPARESDDPVDGFASRPNPPLWPRPPVDRAGDGGRLAI